MANDSNDQEDQRASLTLAEENLIQRESLADKDSEIKSISGQLLKTSKKLEAQNRLLNKQKLLIEKQMQEIKEQKKELELQNQELIDQNNFIKQQKQQLEESNKQLQAEILDRKSYENRLKETLRDLTRSNRDLEQFAYVASHDLQEPLRMINSYVQLFQQRYENMVDEDGQELISFVVDGSNRMKSLINDLLDYSRVGKNSDTLENVDFNELLKEVELNLAIKIQETSTIIDSSLLPNLWVKKVLMLQLFQNLISNAIKFRDGRTPYIKIEAKEQEKYWVFSVADNGIGIEKEYFERIFQIFKRLNSRKLYPGNGIGLAICQKIVESHCGKIWVESDVEKGSTFYFSIPKLTPSSKYGDCANV